MNKESLSQLIDGELDTLAIENELDALLADPALRRSWQTMHTLRAGMSADTAPISLTIADKVSVALADEPAIMAPNSIRVEPAEQTKAENIVPLKQKRNKGLAFLAVAASVAAVVMLGYLPQNEQATSTIARSDIIPVQSEVDMALQSMIVQHGEFSGAAALNGLAAYAKVVNGLNVQ